MEQMCHTSLRSALTRSNVSCHVNICQKSLPLSEFWQTCKNPIMYIEYKRYSQNRSVLFVRDNSKNKHSTLSDSNSWQLTTTSLKQKLVLSSDVKCRNTAEWWREEPLLSEKAHHKTTHHWCSITIDGWQLTTYLTTNDRKEWNKAVLLCSSKTKHGVQGKFRISVADVWRTYKETCQRVRISIPVVVKAHETTNSNAAITALLKPTAATSMVDWQPPWLDITACPTQRLHLLQTAMKESMLELTKQAVNRKQTAMTSRRWKRNSRSKCQASIQPYQIHSNDSLTHSLTLACTRMIHSHSCNFTMTCIDGCGSMRRFWWRMVTPSV